MSSCYNPLSTYYWATTVVTTIQLQRNLIWSFRNFNKSSVNNALPFREILNDKKLIKLVKNTDFSQLLLAYNTVTNTFDSSTKQSLVIFWSLQQCILMIIFLFFDKMFKETALFLAMLFISIVFPKENWHDFYSRNAK